MLNQYQKRKGAYIAHTSYTKESLRTLRPGEWSKKSLGFSMVLILKLPFPCQTSTSAISSRAPLKKPNPQPGVVEHAAPLLQKLVALRAINHWVPGWAWENCTQSLRRLHLPLILRWQPDFFLEWDWIGDSKAVIVVIYTLMFHDVWLCWMVTLKSANDNNL